MLHRKSLETILTKLYFKDTRIAYHTMLEGIYINNIIFWDTRYLRAFTFNRYLKRTIEGKYLPHPVTIDLKSVYKFKLIDYKLHIGILTFVAIIIDENNVSYIIMDGITAFKYRGKIFIPFYYFIWKRSFLFMILKITILCAMLFWLGTLLHS